MFPGYLLYVHIRQHWQRLFFCIAGDAINCSLEKNTFNTYRETDGADYCRQLEVRMQSIVAPSRQRHSHVARSGSHARADLGPRECRKPIK